MIYVLMSLPIALILIRVNRINRQRAFKDRPYRYQSDVRRSKWSHRGGF